MTFNHSARASSLTHLAAVAACIMVASSLLAEIRLASISVVETKEPVPALKMSFELQPPVTIQAVTATAGGADLATRYVPFGNDPMDASALLILVDASQGSSSAPRTRSVTDIAKWISELLDRQGASHRLIGVYAFANDLTEVAPVGNAFADTKAKLAGLRADGLGTRISRSALDALKKLEGVEASRKALLLISDGKEEDTAYKWEELVKAARGMGIPVHCIGYPENPQDIPALGMLEKIASETGALYTQASLRVGVQAGSRVIEPDFAGKVFAAIESGGQVLIDMTSVASGEDVTVSITTQDGTVFEHVVAREPEPTPTPEPTSTPTPEAQTEVAEPDPTPTPVIIQTPTEKALHWAKSNGVLLSLLVGGLLILAIVLLILRANRCKRRKMEAALAERQAAALSQVSEPDAEPSAIRGRALATLILQDAEATRIDITGAATRIGRKPDNDIRFTNDSVSSYHAEIHRKRDGAFFITDLNSGNGVLVNGSRVSQQELRDGDQVELGEVRFRFTSPQS